MPEEQEDEERKEKNTKKKMKTGWRGEEEKSYVKTLWGTKKDACDNYEGQVIIGREQPEKNY